MKGTPAMLLDRQGQTAASRSLFTEKTAILICPKEPFISAREEELSLLKYSLENAAYLNHEKQIKHIVT